MDSHAQWERPLTEMTEGELMALKAEFAARGSSIRNSLSPEDFLLIVGAISSREILETLAARGTNGIVDAVRRRVRKPGAEADGRPHARHVINDALEAWRDQSDEDMPTWMYNPDTVKELARFIRDRLVAAGIVTASPVAEP